MNPANILLLDTLDVSHVPPATAAVPAASSTAPASNQDHSNPFLVYFCHFATEITDVFLPLPVRQGWTSLFVAMRNRFVACPAKYHYGFLAFIILTGLSEWQQPGSILCPENLSNAIIGFLCATSLVLGSLALLDFIETDRWPWEEDGWVWPWQAWLWKETVYDLRASTSTCVAGNDSLLSYTSPSGAETLGFDSPVQSNTITNDSGTMMLPPPTFSKQSAISPSTSQLSIGLRSSFLLPPTPAEIHKSGILGESPMPFKFKHFSGHGFATNSKKLRAVAEWSGPTKMSLEAVNKSAVPEKRASEDKVDGRRS